jgi:hypothetical protein
VPRSPGNDIHQSTRPNPTVGGATTDRREQSIQDIMQIISTPTRVVFRVCFRVSVCPSFDPSLCSSNNFTDANPAGTSDRPSDGPDFCPTFCPTFNRRGYCKNNDHVTPLAGRRYDSKSAVANFRTAYSWGI